MKLIKKVATSVRYRLKKSREKLSSFWAKTLVFTENPKRLISGGDIIGSYIPPEISKDELFNIIKTLVATKKLTNLVEIGPSSGEGSTAAILHGLKESMGNYRLHLIEIDDFRCALLKRKFKKNENISIHNSSSISIQDFPTWDQVVNFHTAHQTKFNKNSLEQVKIWYDADKLKLKSLSPQKSDKIRELLGGNSGSVFDFALIDGCEFTGLAEVKLLYGVNFLVLDDINSYKCFEAYQFLVRSGDYRIYAENWSLRNGYAVFEKVV